MTLSCFCGLEVRRPVLIEVTGTTVTARNSDDGLPVPAQFTAAFPSIDGLFDLLADARNRNASHADATYDATIGYPLQISLDYRSNVADDESFYTITQFMAK